MATRLFSYASPGGKQDKPRGSTHKNVWRVARGQPLPPAEQHIITVAHVICVAITLNRGTPQNPIIDMTEGISSQSFGGRRFWWQNLYLCHTFPI